VIGLRPALLFQVSHYVLASDLGGVIAKQLPNLLDARLVVALPPMAHSYTRRACECIEPTVDFLEGLSEQPNRLCTMLFKGWHGSIN
jgi:hypothetical protein